MTRTGTGRKKIPMKKIDNEINLEVTFSKRRPSLFQKASELCILCDANVGLIVFSPENKAYSFGHPSVDMVINNLDTINAGTNFTRLEMSSSQKLTIQGLNTKINNVDENISTLKARKKELIDSIKAREGQYWWDGPDKDKLTVQQIDLLKVMLIELKDDIQKKKHSINFESNSYVGEHMIDAGTSIGPYDGTGHAHTREE